MNPNFQNLENKQLPRRRTQAENRAYRQESLLKAAITTVAKHDIAGATVERICAEAGASRGLIAHYFDHKEELLIASLVHWFDMVLGIKKEIAASTELSALEKIREIAYVNFSPPSYTWEAAAAWQAFTNASRHNKAYAKPIRKASRVFNKIVSPLFAEAAADKGVEIDAKNAAAGLYILDDGLWNSLATGKDQLTLAQAKLHCDIYIEGCFK